MTAANLFPSYTPRRRGAAYVLVTPPAQEPITLDEAKAQARIADDYSNAIVQGYITTAREAAEEFLGYGLFTQTWRLELASFRDEIALPMALMLQNDAGATPSTAIAVQYYDTAGALTALPTNTYLVDAASRPARITRAPGMTWPSVQADRLAGCVLVTYVVGWTTVTAIPQRIKQGIRSYVTYLELDRDGLEPNAQAARAAAEACWTDRMFWTAPEA